MAKRDETLQERAEAVARSIGSVGDRIRKVAEYLEELRPHIQHASANQLLELHIRSLKQEADYLGTLEEK